MRDFPIFTTEYGTASLILKEVPYRSAAYIRITEVLPGGFQPHLEECISFCTMAGAGHVYATGHEGLESWPLDCSILEMRGQSRVDPDNIACLFPVTEAIAGSWRELYNRLMAPVPHAATLEAREENQIIQALGTYFIHRDGKLLGIGWLEGTKLLALAAQEKGAGQTILNTLMSLTEDQTMTLEVASTNEKAIRLYERMGFVKAREKTRWYRVK